MQPKTKHSILSIWLFLILSSRIFAQFDYYSLEKGLSQANVRCILQDRKGFLWLGTQDGLNRFDGFQFAKFRREVKNPNSLSGNYISCIAEDANGQIIIGTINGISFYDPKLNRFENLSMNSSPTNTNQVGAVSSILCAKDGSIWIGSFYSGVIRKNKNNVARFLKNDTHPNSIMDNYITALCEDRDGNIWIGTFNSGLNKYIVSTGKFEYFTSSQSNNKGLSSNFITSLAADNYGNVIIGTTNGLNVLNTVTNEITIYKNNPSLKNSISGDNIISIYIDRQGKIWLALEGNGVNVFDFSQKTFTKFHVDAESNLVSEEKNIWSIYEDSFGNFWFGTATNGVIKWKQSRLNFKSYTKKIDHNYLSDYSVRSILVDKEKNIWIGTDYGLNKIDSRSGQVKKYFNKFGNETSINSNRVDAINEDQKGNIWFGTQHGLALYDKKKDSFKRFIFATGTKEPLPVFAIRSLHVDENNILWLGTFGAGLFSYNIEKGVFQNHTFSNKNPDAKKDVVIFQIEEDKNEKLWLVTTSGLAVYDKKTQDYQRYFSDSQNDFTGFQSVIYSLNRQNDSTFWVGTLGDGLINFNPLQKSFKVFTEKDKLANNVVYGILKDNSNNLWLSTNYGISKFDPGSNHFRNYDKNDGIPTNEFNTGAFFKDKSGNLYFGGIEGLLYFNPDSIENKTNKPNLILTNFKVFDKELSSNKILFDEEVIRLNYYDNFFSFEFASLDFTSSTNEYAYMLEGYDKGWINSGRRRYAAYTGVYPGEYILRVRSASNSKYVNDAGIRIHLIISPPFWQTLWFRLLFAIILIGVVFLFYTWKINRLKKETEKQIIFSRQLIAAQEGEKKRLAAELHDGVGQNLMIVNNLSQMGIKNPEASQKHLAAISETIKESIKDIRQISKDLHPYQIEELGVTIALQSLLTRVKESTDISFNDFIENVDQNLSLDESINLFRIVQEAINNILKHSNAKSAVLSLSMVDQNIQLIVKDDGVGINKPDTTGNSFGLGLRTMQERATALNGKFNMESNSETGTLIKIIIPK